MKNQHIDIFVIFLEQLFQILSKVEIHLEGDSSILSQRLFEDMLPFSTQVEIAASFALRSCCPIAGTDVDSFVKQEKSFFNLKAQLQETIDHIKKLDSLENNLGVIIEDMAGPAPVTMTASDFLVRFAYPNFYFHLSMVYAIARSRGVPLTKGDFDGLHQYPAGFSFEDTTT